MQKFVLRADIEFEAVDLLRANETAISLINNLLIDETNQDAVSKLLMYGVTPSEEKHG